MSDSQATKASDARGKGAVSRLLAFAGPRKTLTYLGCALSAVSMLVSFGPYVCVWLVARDLIAQGMRTTDACFQCGYHDYSAFSRAYKKRFQVSPRADQTKGAQ